VISAAPALTTLLAGAPGVRMLVTSRASLGVTGETVIVVDPLKLPPVNAVEAAELGANPAVALFLERAHSVSYDFSLEGEHARIVAEICRKLSGIPLAIELAAMRVKVFRPDELLARLSGSLDILSGSRQDQPPRHRTMRASITWSYDLLQPHQQAVFRRLSRFAGGCPLDIAEALGGDPYIRSLLGDESALDAIVALADANLVARKPGREGRPRLTMLEPIRQFGVERLEGSEDSVAADTWFVGWCCALGEQAAVEFVNHGPARWTPWLEDEIDNFRAAGAPLNARNDVPAMLRLLTALTPIWTAIGHEWEGYDWILLALGWPGDVPARDRMFAIGLAVRLANLAGDLPGAERFVNDHLAPADEALGDAHIAGMQTVLGDLARVQGDQDRAGQHYESALSRYRRLDDRYGSGYVLVQLGKLGSVGTAKPPARALELTRAVARCEEALRIYLDLDDQWGIALAWAQLGVLAGKSGAYATAARHCCDALALFTELGTLADATQSLGDLGVVAAAGEGAIAARFYGLEEACRVRLRLPMPPCSRQEYRLEVAALRAALPNERFQQAWQAGQALSLKAALAEARALVTLLETRESQTAPSAPPAARATDRPGGLTARELAVLRLVATGLANQEIAETLYVSVTTVKWHVRNIMHKLDLHSRTALAAWTHQRDLN